MFIYLSHNLSWSFCLKLAGSAVSLCVSSVLWAQESLAQLCGTDSSQDYQGLPGGARVFKLRTPCMLDLSFAT